MTVKMFMLFLVLLFGNVRTNNDTNQESGTTLNIHLSSVVNRTAVSNTVKTENIVLFKNLVNNSSTRKDNHRMINATNQNVNNTEKAATTHQFDNTTVNATGNFNIITSETIKKHHTKTVTTTTTQKKKITILLAHSVKPLDHRGAQSAASVAVKMINDHPTLLKDYTLEIKFSGPVNDGIFFRLLFQNLEDPLLNPMVVMGPLPTSGVKKSYPILEESSLIQINFNGFDESMASTKFYPYLFSTCQLDNTFYPAFINFLKYYDWSRVGLIYLEHINDVTYSRTASKLEQLARANGIDFTSIQSVHLINKFDVRKKENRYPYERSLQKLKDNDARIIILMLESFTMATILCEAYHMGMYGDKYMYLVFHGESLNNWIQDTDFRFFHCTKEQLYTINKNVIFQTRLAKGKDDSVTINSHTVKETWQMIEAEVKRRQGILYRFRERLFYVHDSIWAYAMALDNMLKSDPNYVKDFHWRDQNDTKKGNFAREFKNLNFIGASGEFRFVMDGENRYRYGNTVVYKIMKEGERGGIYYDLGQVTPSQYGSPKINLNNSILSYAVPKDGPLVIKNFEKFPLSLIAILWSISVCGIIISIIFLVINIYYGNVKFMKLSSPNINSLICAGCIISFVAVIFYGLDTRIISLQHIPTMCNIIVLLLCMGFTLTFGSLFSKTWRIYRIFTRSQSLRYVVIKDFHLVSIVVLLLLIDIIVYGVWVGVSPFELRQQVLSKQEILDEDAVQLSIIDRCKCEYQTHFVAVILIYKGLLMLFGLFVAYETRSIKVEAINDSKNIGIAVYNFSFIFTLSIIVSYFLYDTEKYVASYVVFAASITQVTLVTLFLVFVPKVIMLSKNYDDPNFRNGRPVLNTSSKSESHHSTGGDSYAKKWSRSETISTGHYEPKERASSLSSDAKDRTSSLTNGKESAIKGNHAPDNLTNSSSIIRRNNNTDVTGETIQDNVNSHGTANNKNAQENGQQHQGISNPVPVS